MYKKLEPIEQCGILPNVAFDNKEQAVPFAEAISKGGMPFMEVLFRTDAAAESVKEIVKVYPDFLVGAGTIINMEQAEKAIDVGAKFLVMPGLDLEIVEYSLKRKVPVIPGCITPTEIQQALKKGIKLQKFFPAKAFGGTETLKELQGPYPEVKFIVTGGLEKEDGKKFLMCSNVAAVGGFFMYDTEDLKKGQYEKIARQIKECREYYTVEHF